MSPGAAAGQAAPDELKLLLLRAALSEGEQAHSAWRAAGRELEAISELDGESYRLLPLLYRNLVNQGVEDPRLEQLKGVYRHSWYANHLLFHEAGVLLGSLKDAGIDTLVLKGGALTCLYYDAPGTRPMEDVDVLVRERQVRQAIEVLGRNGWKLNAAAPLEGILRTRHSVEYQHSRGQKLDLHWSPLWQPTREEQFWDDAIPLEIGGVRTLALCPEDQLLNICVHGVGWNMHSPYWAADAAMLIRSRQDSFDWAKLVERARVNELSASLEHGLRFLREQLELTEIPSYVIDELAAIPRATAERRAYRIGLGPPRHGGEYLRMWDRYRRQAALEGRRPTVPDFLTYVRENWGLANRRQLIGRLFRKGGQIARHGVSHPTGAGEPPTDRKEQRQ
jgi:hypothetical protein